MFLSLVITLGPIASGHAQQAESYPPSLVVVPSGKMARVGFVTSLDIKCRFLHYVPIDVIEMPAYGQIFLKKIADYPTYGSYSDRYGCNRVRNRGVEIIYKSRPGFIGNEEFTIRMININSVPYLKHYVAQVK